MLDMTSVGFLFSLPRQKLQVPKRSLFVMKREVIL